MTTESQTFIGLEEILSIRVQCTFCKTKMIVSLASQDTQERARVLTSRFLCPHCNAQWFVDLRDSRLQKLEKFVASLIEMRNRVKEFKSDGVGLALALEIEPPRGPQ